MDSCFAIISGFILIILLAAMIIVIIVKDAKYFKSKDFQGKYGSFVEGLRIGTRKINLLYNVILLFRRFIFSITVIFFGE